MIIIIVVVILKSFPKVRVNYYREISNRLYSPTSCFLLFLPYLFSHFYILSNLVYPSDSGSSSWSLSFHFYVQHFFQVFFLLPSASHVQTILCSFERHFLFHSLLVPILYWNFLSCSPVFWLKFLLKIHFHGLNFVIFSFCSGFCSIYKYYLEINFKNIKFTFFFYALVLNNPFTK